MSEVPKIKDPAGPSAYSKDYWDIVFEQLGRRRLFRAAVVVLALIYASAIFAPLIANDRPLVLEAANYGEYNKAHRTLLPAALGLGRVAKTSAEDYLEGRARSSDFSYAQALEQERLAIETQVLTLQNYLAPDRHGALDEVLGAAEELARLGLAGDTESAKELASKFKAQVKAVRADYAAGDPAHPEEGGLQLQGGRTSYPLLESIGRGEMFFMVLWGLLLSWPLWNRLTNRILGMDRGRIRSARKPKLACVLTISVGAALLWGATIGGEMTFATAPYKDALTDGEIVATRVVFPLLSQGFAESNNSEDFRPPTWVEAAMIDEDGYYEHGARMPQPDPITGYMPPAVPVRVRFSEAARNAPSRHLLGTDSIGRDMLVRLLWGGRVSLSVGLVSAFLLVLIGTVVGAIAGYGGGAVDLVISRVIEIVLCFPAFFLILMVVAFTDPDSVPPIIAIVVVIALVRWTGVARLARGEFLKLRDQEFVVAARAMGFSPWRTIFRHILPNAMGPILVSGAFAVAAGILTESALSFLGFGIQHPVPSWGSLVVESRSAEHWWIQIFPGLAIFVTVLCYNLIGDAFRDALDPKMKKESEE
ncbi:MAG: ABC transporter permease [bacterium]|jgi:peptide/nickel transport system permease protein|nr:ABC transporter permease [Planctomycetota bacterium]HIL51385.1 ABC transporter permease [Planctomycetota bacterium]